MRLSQQTDIGIERKDRAEIEVETLRDGCSFRHSSERSPKGSCGPNSERPLSISEIWRHPCRQWCAVKTTRAAGFSCRVDRAEGAFSGQVITKDSAPEGVWNLLVGARKRTGLHRSIEKGPADPGCSDFVDYCSIF